MNKIFRIVSIVAVVLVMIITGCNKRSVNVSRIVFLGSSLTADGKVAEIALWWNIAKDENAARIDGPSIPYENKDYDMNAFLTIDFDDGSQIAMPIQNVKVHTQGQQKLIISFNDFYIEDNKQFSAFEITCNEFCFFSKPFVR